MKPQQKNKIKALFLLAVFSLNTVVAFACSVGVVMGFNREHHSYSTKAQAVDHLHYKSDKRNVHHEKKESLRHSKEHKHSSSITHQHGNSSHPHTTGSDKENCCKDEVVKLNQTDKFVPLSFKLVHPVFFTAFLASYDHHKLLPYSGVVKEIKPFVRSYHPPIPDVRIAIQSFQI